MNGTHLTFDAFRQANVTRCQKWHPARIDSWSPSDWLTALAGEVGELASLLKMLKMLNRERDGLPGNKFSPTQKHIADELADVLTYLDLLAEVLGVDLGRAAVEKFNEVSERVGFPDRIVLSASPTSPSMPEAAQGWIHVDRQMPKSGQIVLALQKWDHSGKLGVIRAAWVAAKTEESSPESDIGEYDEATDTYYDPEGWYEQISHWDEIAAAGVNGATIVAWMPLPDVLSASPAAPAQPQATEGEKPEDSGQAPKQTCEMSRHVAALLSEQVQSLTRQLSEERETVRQLNHALREATESPTFMGEPVAAQHQAQGEPSASDPHQHANSIHQQADQQLIHLAAQQLINQAEALNHLVTIERKPLQPLAMGHGEYVVSIWPKREPA